MSEIVRIGLCGRSGAGKGYVCRIFDQLGIPSVDTDAVYREMTGPAETLSPCMEELLGFFGEKILREDRSLNRPVLSSLVFGENAGDALAQLNRITHRHILLETEKRIADYARQGYKYVLIDAPVLFESGFDSMCRFTVCVIASEETSVTRITERDGITKEAAQRRLAAQMTNEELMCRCDYHIENELHCDTLRQQIARVTDSIRSRTEEAE